MNINKTCCAIVLYSLLISGSLLSGAQPDKSQKSGNRPLSESAQKMRTLQEKALNLMSDIVPVHVPTETQSEVSLGKDRASFGFLFGDRSVAALVALEQPQGKGNQEPDKTDLCLLLWDHSSWNFAQYVGAISSRAGEEGTKDWTIKTDETSGTSYLLAGLNLYPARPHPSWIIDRKTHRLIPSGWPSDSIPSIAKDCITFTREEKPGYSPPIREVHRFNGQPGAKVATITTEGSEPQSKILVTLWEGSPAKGTTWYVWRKSNDYNKQVFYIVSRNLETEEVLVEFNWEETYPQDSAAFLLWRLTNLNRSALEGKWEQEPASTVTFPKTAKVTGPEDMVKRLQWPQEPSRSESESSGRP